MEIQSIDTGPQDRVVPYNFNYSLYSKLLNLVDSSLYNQVAPPTMPTNAQAKALGHAAFSFFSLSCMILLTTASPAQFNMNHTLIARETSDDVGWALAVLSEKEKLSVPVTEGTYYYLPTSAEGVDVYVLDSGINHIDALEGVNIKDEFVCEGDDASDNRDHGTRIAGLITSDKYGSAKKANLYSYKVDVKGAPNQDCVVKALKQVTAKVKERKTQPGYKGSVVNLSINLDNTDALATQIDSVLGQNIAFITTPGNLNEDSKTVFPCAYDGVICVGAIDKNYERWENSSREGSGYGARVTIWAPGKDITSYNNEGNIVTDVTGTSFAAPLVAGIVATFYGFEGPLKPAEVIKRLNVNAENDVLSGLRSKSPNKLANNGYRKAGENDKKPYLLPEKARSISKTSTTTAAPITAPTTVSTPAPTSKVVIAFGFRDFDFNWEFFAAPISQSSFDLCSPYTSYTITPFPTVAASVALPTGTFSIGEVGKQHQEDNCVYTNQGNGNGTMSCDGVGGFDCDEISSSKYNKDGDCTDNSAIDWRIQCQW